MIKKAWDKTIRFLMKAGQDSLAAYSAQAAFFVLLSFFPFVILVVLFLSKLTFVNVDIIPRIISVVPGELDSYVQYIIEDLQQPAKYSFTLVAIVVCLWSAGKAIQALYNALNIIYGLNKERKGFIGGRILCAAYTLIFIFAFILLMIVEGFGHQAAMYFADNWPMMSNILQFILGFKKLFSFGLMFVFFLLMYYQLPERKGVFRHEILGAFGATIAWSLLKSWFAWYIKYAAGGSYMYGSMSYIVMLLIWLYLGMQIILYGAEFNWFILPSLHKQKIKLYQKLNIKYEESEEYLDELAKIEARIAELDEMMKQNKDKGFFKNLKKKIQEKKLIKNNKEKNE